MLFARAVFFLVFFSFFILLLGLLLLVRNFNFGVEGENPNFYILLWFLSFARLFSLNDIGGVFLPR